jgi:hypothetical protein
MRFCNISYEFMIISDARWGDTNWSENMIPFPKLPASLLLSSYSQTTPKPVITVAPTIHSRPSHTLPGKVRHNLWSDKILPAQNSCDRQKLDFDSDGGPLGSGSESDRQRLTENGDKHNFGKHSDRPVLNRSVSVTEPCAGRLSRLDLSRRSVSLAEKQMALRKVTINSDIRSSSDRMCRDNILQLLSDRLQSKDSQQAR